MNPAIGADIEADPSGATVPDGDVQFVVNSNFEHCHCRLYREPARLSTRFNLYE